MKDFLLKYRIIFNSHERKRFAQIALLQLISSLLEMLAVYAILPFVSALESPESILNYKLFELVYDVMQPNDLMKFIAFTSLSIGVLYIVKNLYVILLNKIQLTYVYRLSAKISKEVLSVLLKKPYYYHVQTNSANILQYTTRDVDTLFGSVLAIFSLINNSISMVLIIIVLFKTSVIFTTIAALIVVGAMLIVIKIISPKMKSLGETTRIYNAQKIKWVNESEGGLKGIIANKKQDFFVSGYANASSEYAVRAAKHQIILNLPRCVMEMVVLGGLFLVGAITMLIIEDPSGLIPIFAMFAMAAYRLISIANTVNSSINIIKFNAKAVDELYTILREKDSELISEEPRDLCEGSSLQTGIKIENISFHFEDDKEWLYKDFSLEIPANKSVAFIGTTGSGKTTLADIIIGLQIPQEGKILVDGIDIKTAPYWWANRIGYIPQIIYLCDDTIRANVAFGVDSNVIDDDIVWDCLEKAKLDDFVKGLPDGLNTIVGENGMRLSGGQRQRIGIARALYTNPPFIVMDEATSALDNETEQSIIDAIEALAGEKTMLIIAHRLTTIKNCDYIYKINEGKAELVKFE